MQDPPAENIEGQKIHKHTAEYVNSFNHNIDWGWVAASVAIIFVVLYFDPLNRFGESDDEADDGGDGFGGGVDAS